MRQSAPGSAAEHAPTTSRVPLVVTSPGSAALFPVQMLRQSWVV